MNGNKLLYSKYKEDRIKGYRKLLKKQTVQYSPPKDIVKDIVEAMEAQGYDIDTKQSLAYLRASYAAFDRRYYLQNNK